MKDTVWVCKDGTSILVSKMETRHILNCIRMIQRKRGWRREYLDRLELELIIRQITAR